MFTLAFSAAAVGALHSLAPGHWLPVVLMAKSRKWGLGRALLGAVAAAAGHIVVSGVLGMGTVYAGLALLPDFQEALELYGAAGLIVFGLAYAVWAYFNHSHCVGHTHHGPVPKKRERLPFLFLFGIGLSPCIAALPIFVASGQGGFQQMGLTLLFFATGVLGALAGATWLVSKGLMKLDHPIFEHYGDVLTGLGVSLAGLLLIFGPHSH
jgi:nickel/cobalt exporter